MPEQHILSATVPGAIDAWHRASQKFGQRDFADLLQPAIHYAEQGYAVTPVIAANWKMNLTIDESVKAAEKLAKLVEDVDKDLAVYPTFVAAQAVADR